MTTLQDLERLRRDTMEKEVVNSLHPDLTAMVNRAQKEHEDKGGCTGCGSMTFAVHDVSCPTLRDDIF